MGVDEEVSITLENRDFYAEEYSNGGKNELRMARYFGKCGGV